MVSCITNCIEKPIRIGFERFGKFVGLHPWWFVSLPLVMSAALGGGFYFLQDLKSNNIVEQFTPNNGRAKVERRFFQETFPQTDTEFSVLRLNTDGVFASVIFSCKTNVFSADALEEILRIDGEVKGFIANHSSRQLTFSDICATVNGKCYPNALLDVLNYNASNIHLVNVTFPMHCQSEFNCIYFGNDISEVDVDDNGVVQSAKAVRLVYFLQENSTLGDIWLQGFVNLLGNATTSLTEVTFCDFKCKTVFAGIGIDDMFIMISSWQRTNVQDSVPDRMACTYREAAISITITTLTDVLAFYLSFSNPFGSVRSFCLYAGTGVFFCYLYNITFFGACLALNGRREGENRHWLTCMKVPDEYSTGQSKAYTVCCVGGSYNHTTGTEEVHPMTRFFRNYYGPLLTTIWSKVIVILLYLLYVAVSVYGCLRLKEGIDLKNLALDESYVVQYYEAEKNYFDYYGPNVMLAVNGTFQYWDENERQLLKSCIVQFQELDFVQNISLFWVHSFEKYAKETRKDISSEAEFKTHLFEFLDHHPMFRQDVNITNANITASRLFLQTFNISSKKTMLNSLRETAENCQWPLVVYHPAFIYYDQYTVIGHITVQTIGVATAVMLVISLVLIPNPLCALWVTFAIASVILGVTGCMALLNINLDSISMINLVISIGFSVDFSAHISYMFVSSAKSDVNERVVEALTHMGFPILQGALSTIVGVVVLSASTSYIFRTLFTIVFLVIVFGLFHGIAFIPVFLTFTGFCHKFWQN
ncbi:Patched domain-containing protein 3 RND-type protein RNDEu-3 [Triplophysa tibetana]|uniref:Patched domain-containing protein 3 n=1 Tax=Triplophysa tibetana TaxID=1572043 RepID=A0A5A9PDN1_9TELE|nr:Patched domain-containing protein 3 RND-type protein RNDEu-3 [Triplophysa tibetana]